MRRIVSAIRDGWCRARAVVVIGTLLDRAEAGNDSRLARAVIDRAWRAYPARLNGNNGQRPRHEVTALFALALAAHRDSVGERVTPALRQALDAGLGKRGLYQQQRHEWTQPHEADLVAFARAVLRKKGSITEPEATR